ncbi:hypothetical protein LTS08_003693 [Lithohypha guttulata]|uniref:Uncharacterized protein n=1 Tax=Lithohypha guttulata TaxID=1690604 RepID=A0AAN7SWG7_9EURO|nr:hypothetical protein LTR05_006002 [Lithohypha guttulata]KAK5102891.1 hypothetical protein LTS08_003693 [Lithohypha guttulata]
MAHRPHHGSYTVSAPVHPVSQLQGPFEESMLESVHEEAGPDNFLNPIARRNILLEAPVYQRVVAGRWKQKPGEQFHPLWKLIAQIAFGIHLLAERMAKSEDDVMQILQAHVDEIDGFLERTTEDFDLAAEDIQERLRCLKLPLSHPGTFDKMLEDRNFRLSIVEGNEKIEHIVERTTQAMKDSLKDVQKGFDSTSCLELYLQSLCSTWRRSTVEHEAVFVAMLGNVEGWRKAFLALHVQGNKLGGSLKRLTDIINEMQARAGEVSRRLLHQAKVQHQQIMGRPTGRSTPTSRFQTQPTKQLPGMPRPPLRQAASNDTVRSAPPLRAAASQESLRHNALLNRAQTPQDGIPAPRQVNKGASPRIVQIGSNSQARVQSMVPSLLAFDASPSTDGTPTEPQIINYEEQLGRHFPPVELPAHVPQETMRQAPMSKQNRLSMGLTVVQDDRHLGKRTSTLVDLLRSDPAKADVANRPTSRSSEMSQRVSTLRTVSTEHTLSPDVRRTTSMLPPPQPSSSISDTTSIGEGLSVQDGRSPRVTTITVQGSGEQDGLPGTPAWATTTFAQAEKKKELLKRGAFSSHPPDLPLGSPPLNQGPGFVNPLALAAARRQPSRSSSAGQSTLGEPGPEVTASESGSAHSGRRGHHDKRASAYAPEVVVDKVPPLPVPSKQFIAEMEGSSPVPAQNVASTRNMVMELEAPRQHFVLPPRPQLKPLSRTETAEMDAQEQLVHQPHFVLPPNPKMPTSSAAQSNQLVEPEELAPPPPPRIPVHSVSPCDGLGQLATGDGVETNTLSNQLASQGKIGENVAENSVDSDKHKVPTSKTLEAADRGSEKVATIHDTKQDGDIDVIPQVVHSEKEPARSSSVVFVSTPNIPIPPSPFGESWSQEEVHQSANTQCATESLYILPALTYKAPPISPRLPPDPVTYRRTSESPSSSTRVDAAQQYSTQDSDSIAEKVATAAEEVLIKSSSDAQNTGSTFVASTDDGELPQTAVSSEEPSGTITSNTTSAKSAATPVTTTNRSITRERRPSELQKTGTKPSNATNEWKAFFTGQPSPAGSNLSIRSIRRESLIDGQSQKSPSLLSPTSITSKHAFPPTPMLGKSVEESGPGSDGKQDLTEAIQVEEVAPVDGLHGLGISTTHESESNALIVSDGK